MRIRDLGPLAVEDKDGHPIAVPGTKQQAVLSMLVLEANRRVSVDDLTAAGWGQDWRTSDAAIENQISRLRRALHLTRDAAAVPALVNEQGGYRLAIDPAAVDSQRFGELAAVARRHAEAGAFDAALDVCDEALRLWRGVPYEVVVESRLVEASVARLTELHGQMREWRVDALLATGNTDRALADLEVLTAESPLRERLWVQRMTGLARAGRVAEALATYQRVRTLLLDELGLEPGAELRELQRALIAQDLPSRPPQPSAASSLAADAATAKPAARRSALPAWPMVGRSAELAQIARIRAASGAGAVLVAPAGVGKSRLAHTVLDDLAEQGAFVVTALATRSAASIPLGAFSAVLPDLDGDQQNLLGLVQRVSRLLREQAGEQLLVLGVDDAHLLDPASATLVLHLATSGGAFVVATVRSGEPCPDAIDALWKDAGCTRIDLAPLDGPATGELAEALLEGPLERAAQQWCFDVTGGNALYVEELMQSARAQGALKQLAGLWCLAGRPQVPTRLSDIVSAALEGLSDAERDVLEILALGEPLALDGMGALLDQDALLALDARRLLAVSEESHGASVRLGHPLYGDVIRAELTPLKTRTIYRRLSEAATALADAGPQHVLRTTRWQLDAGISPPVEQLIAAAHAASERAAPRLAAQFASRARAAGAGVEADLVLARALARQRHYDEAEALLLRAEPNLRNQDQAATYLEQQSEVLHWGLRRPDALHELLRRAAKWWPGPQWSQVMEPFRRRVESFEQLAATAASPQADPAAIGNLFYSGHTAAALSLAHRLRPTPPLRNLDEAIALSLWCRITLETGHDWPGFDAWCAPNLEEAVRLGDAAAAGQLAYSLAGLRLAQGRYPQVLRLLAEAEHQFSRQDPLGLLPVVAAMRVTATLFAGDAGSAPAAMAHCRDLLGNTAPLAHQAPYIARAQAWATYAAGDHPAAQRILLDTAGEFSDSPVHQARLTYEAMRAGAPPQSLLDVLDQARHRCDAALVACYADHAAARCNSDRDSLHQVAQAFERIGALRYASEVLTS